MKLSNVKQLLKLIGIFAGSILIYSFSYYSFQEEWVVPAKYKSMKNPTDKTDSENLSIGKTLYMKHCKSCHGKTGLGDGAKAEELDTPAGDFSVELKDQKDGELFYKTKEGRDDMPSFAKKISDDEDIWLIIDFVRTLQE